MGGIDLMFINMTPNEVDTLQIRSFVKNSQFTVLVSEYAVHFDDDLDTVYLQRYHSKYPEPGYLSGDYDYQIVTKNHVYEIQEMRDLPSNTTYCRHNLVWATCYTKIIQLRKNGVNMTTGNLEYLVLEN